VPPTRLGSQAINKSATTELVKILKSSSLFDKILKATDSDMLSKVGRNKRLIRDGLEKNCESEESADKSTEEDSTQRTRETTTETTPSEWALKEGTIPDHNDYSVLHHPN
jgi:hypothetical protein